MIFYFYKYSGNAIFLINSSCKFDQASDDVKKFVILIGGDRPVFFTCAHTGHTRYVIRYPYKITTVMMMMMMMMMMTVVLFALDIVTSFSKTTNTSIDPPS